MTYLKQPAVAGQKPAAQPVRHGGGHPHQEFLGIPPPQPDTLPGMARPVLRYPWVAGHSQTLPTGTLPFHTRFLPLP